MEPIYVETKSNELLYCVYYEPLISENNSKGIILCYPLGQEYLRCHKTYVNLAQRLSAQGFHVIKFDFFGTGDSSGDLEEASISEWLLNIDAVINELESGCDISELIIVGVRFGANLSLLISKRKKVDKLVLWCPIKNGKDYLRSISKDYKLWLLGSFAKQKKNVEGSLENFGFLFTKALIDEIKNITIKGSDFDGNTQILLLDENDSFNIKEKPNVTFQNIINMKFWYKKEAEMGKSLVPIQEIMLIENWLSGYND